MVLAPAGRAWAVRRRYRDETMVLETEFDTVWLVDFTPPRGDAADVVRIVEGVRPGTDAHGSAAALGLRPHRAMGEPDRRRCAVTPTMRTCRVAISRKNST